ncbi:MAG TPA: hypothetical protein VGQ49_05540 [Bryobacteraceae bacterium]|nr:hypothetical protein [Bryobacteraceae bacterium]
MSPLKRLAIRSFAWGAGCGLALAVVLGAIVFYEQRPKGWDVQALRVKHTEARPLTWVNEKDEVLDDVSSGVTFTVDVENTTGDDLTLSRSLTTMGQTRGSHSLHGSFLKVSADYFLPAGHVTTVSLDAELCTPDTPPQQCFDSFFKEDENIVILDESHKYEILIPIPVLTLSPASKHRAKLVQIR